MLTILSSNSTFIYWLKYFCSLDPLAPFILKLVEIFLSLSIVTFKTIVLFSNRFIYPSDDLFSVISYVYVSSTFAFSLISTLLLNFSFVAIIFTSGFVCLTVKFAVIFDNSVHFILPSESFGKSLISPDIDFFIICTPYIKSFAQFIL